MTRSLYLATLAVLLLVLACSSGSDGDASPTPAASPTSAPTLDAPTVGPTATDPPPAAIVVGDPIEFPDGVALIVETGCWQCDGPTGGFVRVYRRPDGSIAQDILFTPGQLDLPPDDDGWSPYVLGFAMRPDASEMAVAICVTRYCGGLGPAEEGASAKLYHSTDGGVTWTEWDDLPINQWIIGFTEDGILTGRQTNIGEGTKPDNPGDAPNVTPVPPEFEFLVLPDGSVVTPPEEAGSSALPVLADSGEVWWADDEGRVLRGDGSVVFSLPDPEARIGGVRGHLKSGLLVDWREADPDGLVLTLYSGSGLEPATVHPTVKSPRGLVTHAGPWTFSPEYEKSLTLYGNLDVSLADIAAPTPLDFGLVPALIDIDTNTAYPILSPFLDGTSILPNPRNRIFAVQRGPFARVTGTGSCLNLRAEPSLSGAVLNCVADGVLLHDTGRTADDADGREWLQVGHPSGPGGWAATDFLER